MPFVLRVILRIVLRIVLRVVLRIVLRVVLCGLVMVADPYMNGKCWVGFGGGIGMNVVDDQYLK